MSANSLGLITDLCGTHFVVVWCLIACCNADFVFAVGEKSLYEVYNVAGVFKF